MDFKYAKIDTTSNVDDIKKEIERLSQMSSDKKNEEQAIKTFIASVYGATGNPYFVGFNVDVAEAITLQGQDLIKFVKKRINTYFKDFWYRDKELHSKLNVTNVRKIDDDIFIYGDTDSAFITFEPVMDSCVFDYDPINFIHKIYEFRLNDYMIKSFDKYAEGFGTKNIQDLELETISYSGIILKKKQYALDKAWKTSGKKGVYYKPQERIDVKGMEIIKGSTPPFVRKRLKNMLNVIFLEGKQLNLRKIVEMLKAEKQAFMLDSIENVSMSSSLSDYNKGILKDTDKLVINKGCPIHVRSAGFHNYLLNQNPKLKNKYQLIKSGDKIKYYHAKVDKNGENIFAYLPNNFPIEIAPPIDYEFQFAKSFIEPLNRFISALGLPKISSELVVKTQLF